MIEYGTAPEPGTVRLMRVLPGPIERIWAHLTEPEHRVTWFADGPIQLRVGGRVELHFNHDMLSAEPKPDPSEEHGGGEIFFGHVTRCEAPRLLSYTWWEEAGENSEVTFELTPRGQDVLLVLTHRRLGDRETIVSVASDWHAHLDILEDRLFRREPRPFWSTYAQLKAEYEERIPASAAEPG